MPNPRDAEEHLRVIRSLMERATHYRAVSAQGALVGGVLSLLVAGVMYSRAADAYDARLFAVTELIVWLLVLVMTAAANLWFLWRDERGRGEPSFSPRAWMALRALLPSFLFAGVLTFALGLIEGTSNTILFFCWSALYGLALLATAHFAPRSIIILGWAFLSVPAALILVVVIAQNKFFGRSTFFELCMGATFGLFHLVYALLTWPRKNAVADSAPAADPDNVRL